MNICVYTTTVCPSCKQLKQALEKQKKTYKEMDMATPEALTELNMNGVFTMAAPVLQVEDKFYTYDTLFKDNKLDTKLLNDIITSQEVPT